MKRGLFNIVISSILIYVLLFAPLKKASGQSVIHKGLFAQVNVVSANTVGGHHTVTLTFTASVGAPPITYNVWRSTVSGAEDSGTTSVLVNPSPINGSPFTDTTVMDGTNYFYVVRAINSNGVASVDSNEATAVIPAFQAPPPQPPPPTGLAAAVN